MTAPILLQAHAVSLSRQGRAILSDIDLTLHTGEVLGIIGANGAGKSSLLQALSDQLPLTSGQIVLAGKPLLDWPERERAQRLALLAQGRELHWPMTVESVVALGRQPWTGGATRLSAEDQSLCEQAMQQAGVLALRAQSCDQLSGGELARVLLARALAVNAQILLADEPIAGLDPYYQLAVMQVLRAQADKGRAVAVVLHDLNLAARFCDRLLLLHQGRILSSGQPEQVLQADTLARAFRIETRIVGDEPTSIIVPVKCLD